MGARQGARPAAGSSSATWTTSCASTSPCARSSYGRGPWRRRGAPRGAAAVRQSAGLERGVRGRWTFRALETLAAGRRASRLRVLARAPASRRGRAVARARHRRQRRDVQPRERHPAAAASVPAADRLVRLDRLLPERRGRGAAGAEPHAGDRRRGRRTRSSTSPGTGEAVRLVGSHGLREPVLGARSRARAGPQLRGGRRPPGPRPHRPPEPVALAEPLRRRRRPSVGRTIVLEGVERQVVGVMPPGFHFPSAVAQLWVPAAARPEPAAKTTGASAGCRSWRGSGPGSRSPQAQDELRSMIARVADAVPVAEPELERGRRGPPAAARTSCGTCAAGCSCCSPRWGSCC